MISEFRFHMKRTVYECHCNFGLNIVLNEVEDRILEVSQDIGN